MGRNGIMYINCTESRNNKISELLQPLHISPNMLSQMSPSSNTKHTRLFIPKRCSKTTMLFIWEK